MIAHLRGKLIEKGLQRVVVDVGGVGYLVHLSAQTLAELPAVGGDVELRCHTHVREDALQIYGFSGEREQDAFELLILVSGIGPKLALTILSGMSVGDLIGAIAGADLRKLQTIPGVGKKTAERMVVELRERCAKLGLAPAPGRPVGGAASAGPDVVEALVNLGYKRSAAEKAVDRVLEGGGAPTAEQLLRAALGTFAEP